MVALASTQSSAQASLELETLLLQSPRIAYATRPDSCRFFIATALGHSAHFPRFAHFLTFQTFHRPGPS